MVDGGGWGGVGLLLGPLVDMDMAGAKDIVRLGLWLGLGLGVGLGLGLGLKALTC